MLHEPAINPMGCKWKTLEARVRFPVLCGLLHYTTSMKRPPWGAHSAPVHIDVGDSVIVGPLSILAWFTQQISHPNDDTHACKSFTVSSYRLPCMTTAHFYIEETFQQSSYMNLDPLIIFGGTKTSYLKLDKVLARMICLVKGGLQFLLALQNTNFTRILSFNLWGIIKYRTMVAH